MKSFKKIIAVFAAVISLLLVNPVNASAEWRQSGSSWWYSQGGSSYATGWKQIDGQWYYFDADGYMKTGWVCDGGNWYYFYGEGTMAHDCWVGDYYLGHSGAWTTDIPVVTSSSTGSSYNNYGTSSTNNNSQTVYIASSGNGTKYHSRSNCSNMKGTISMTLSEAQADGYTACKKCW